MALAGNLVIRSIHLNPGTVLEVSGEGFDIVMLTSGCAYRLQDGRGVLLKEGELSILDLRQNNQIVGAKYDAADLKAFTVRVEWLQGITSVEDQTQIQRRLKALSLASALGRDHPGACALRAPSDLSQRHCFTLRIQALRVLSHLFHPSGKDASLDIRFGEQDCESRMRQFVSVLSLLELKDISVQELSQECGCSVRHAGRVFRNLYGQSLRAKQVEIRMDQARELLGGEGIKIDRIATLCGYSDSQHLRVAFRRHFGMAPTTWRAQQRGRSAKLLPTETTSKGD